jgi:hypothetical protein
MELRSKHRTGGGRPAASPVRAWGTGVCPSREPASYRAALVTYQADNSPTRNAHGISRASGGARCSVGFPLALGACCSREAQAEFPGRAVHGGCRVGGDGCRPRWPRRRWASSPFLLALSARGAWSRRCGSARRSAKGALWPVAAPNRRVGHRLPWATRTPCTCTSNRCSVPPPGPRPALSVIDPSLDEAGGGAGAGLPLLRLARVNARRPHHNLNTLPAARLRTCCSWCIGYLAQPGLVPTAPYVVRCAGPSAC